MPSCELSVFLLMLSVFSTTLSLSALWVLRNHTQNESSATLSALFLTRLPAAPAPVLNQPKNPAEPHLSHHHSLSLHPLALFRFKMDLSASEEQQTRLPFLCGQTQKHSVDRVKGFCVCNTLKYKDDKRNKQWKWACFCRGEWLMNMSCVLHTSSWSIVGEVMKSL